MSYNYQTERAVLFTEEGQIEFLAIRDRVHALLNDSGAFTQEKLHIGGDSWFVLAALDRLVELKEIVCLRENCSAQYKVYASPKVNNR
jgi:hypothetical protein